MRISSILISSRSLVAIVIVSVILGCGRTEESIGAETTPKPRAWGDPIGSDVSADGRPLRMRDRATGIEMILCPRGTFVMGSAYDEFFRDEDETERTVEIEAFYLAAHETTQAEWQTIMGRNPSLFQPRENPPTNAENILRLFDEALQNRHLRDSLAFESYILQGGGSFPVERVSWDDIAGKDGFLEHVQKSSPSADDERLRLPTEAEWEYACRAGTKTSFSVGERMGGRDANIDAAIPSPICGDFGARERTVPVGRFAPNPWGFFDMHGNVWEWCSDAGAKTGEHVIRGGSWASLSFDCRSGSRDMKASSTREGNIGFRLARSAGHRSGKR